MFRRRVGSQVLDSLSLRLIKINQNIEYKPKNINIHRVGISKMKNLQTGTLKTGIYRNFYRGQFKSGPQLPSTPMD